MGKCTPGCTEDGGKRGGLTWLVKLAARRLTTVVSSLQVPRTSRTMAWPPRRPSVPTSSETRVTCVHVNKMPHAGLGADLLSKATEFVDHGVDDVLELNHDRALDRHGDLLAEIALGHGLAHAGDVLDLGLEELELLYGGHACR
jgi:hypothetical protein